MKQYVLVGNFGVGNLGDEALKEYFLTRFPGVEWRTVSAHPSAGELPRLPAGIRSFFALGWIRTIAAMKKADGMVFGGGTLFTDVESVRACFLWWMHAFAARALGTPRYFAFQGIGPFRTRAGEWFCRSALTGAAHISVRDDASRIRAERLVKSIKIVQSFDPVFCLLKDKKSHERTEKILGVIPRKNSGAMLRKSVAETVSKKSFDKIVILSLQSHDKGEHRYCADLGRELDAEVHPVCSIDDLAHEVGQCSRIVTQRYHGGVAALALGIPYIAVPQGEGDKLSTLNKLSAGSCEDLVQSGELPLREIFGL